MSKRDSSSIHPARGGLPGVRRDPMASAFADLATAECEPRWTGDALKARCPHPDHADRTPSLTVRLDEYGDARFRCWSRNCPSDEIVRALTGDVSSYFATSREAGRRAALRAREERSKGHVAALRSRAAVMADVIADTNWTAEAITAMGVGYAVPSLTASPASPFQLRDDAPELPDGMVTFPERFASGGLVNIASWRPKGWRHEAHGRFAGQSARHHGVEAFAHRGLTFESVEAIRTAGEIWFCEGASSALALASLGRVPIALPSAGYRLTDALVNMVDSAQKVYMLPDCDDAGLSIMSRLSDRLALRAAEVWTVDLGADDKGYDVADLLRDFGPAAAEDVLTEAVASARRVAGEHRGAGRPAAERERAKAIVRRELQTSRPWSDVLGVGLAEGVSQATMRRAKRDLGIITRQGICSLPSASFRRARKT
jgi:hypothetical protein